MIFLRLRIAHCRLPAAVIQVLLLINLPAAAGGAPGSSPLRCSGADTMQGLVRGWAAGFRTLQPRARVTVRMDRKLSAEGVVDLLAGRADCVTFAREPFPSEIAAYKARFGSTPAVIPVALGSYATPHATDAMAIYVNARNPLRQATMRQLATIFTAPPPGMAAPKLSWALLGLRGAWGRRPIHLYGMTQYRGSGNPPGIVNYLTLRLLGGHAFRSDVRAQPDRPGTSALQAIVEQVAADPDGIGYSTFAFARPGAKTIAVARDAQTPAYAGTRKAVAHGDYPLTRTIYLGFRRGKDGRIAPIAAQFLHYVLSARGQAIVSRSTERFLPLTGMALDAARAQIDARAPSVKAAYGTDGLPRYTPRRVVPPAKAHYLTPGGAISVIGYNDMREMLAAIDTLFEASHPGIRFDLVLKGTRTAPGALAQGRSAFAPMGAEFEPVPLARYRQAVGAAPLQIRVAHASLDPAARSSPLAVYVNRANPMTGTMLEQLAKLFAEAPHVRARHWGQAGLSGEWRGRAIHLYGLGAQTALGRFFAVRVLHGRAYAQGYMGFPESRDVIGQVGRDPGAIGFADLNQADPVS